MGRSNFAEWASIVLHVFSRARLLILSVPLSLCFMASSLALSKESDSSFAVSAVKLLFVIKTRRLGVNLDSFLVFMGNS